MRGLILVGVLASVVAAGDVKLAEVPAGLEVARDIVPLSNFGSFRRRGAIAWSDDGAIVAYAARGDAGAVPVVGGRVGDAVHRVSRPHVVGGRVFFHCTIQESASRQRHFVLVDGVALKAEDWIGHMSVGPAGDRVAYWTHPGARTGNEVRAESKTHYLAVARLRGSGSWKISRGTKHFSAPWRAPVWNADGTRVYSSGLTRKGWVVLRVDRRERPVTDEHGGIASLAVGSPDALAYVATDPNGAAPELWFKGRRVGAHHPHVARPAVDAAGERVAFVAGRTVAVGDEKSPPGSFDFVLDIAFSPGGDRLAFVAVKGGRDANGIVEGGEWFVVTRPTEGDVALTEHGPFAEARDLVWDAAGERLAFATRDADGWRVACGAARSDAFDDVGRPHFLADGVGHGTREGRALWWRVLPLGP